MATAPTIITNIPRELDTKQYKDDIVKCLLIQKEIDDIIATRNLQHKDFQPIFNARIIELNRQQFSIGKSEYLTRYLKKKKAH